MKNIVRIQQKELENKTLPYPFFIDEDGFVGRQDLWKGRPYKLLGFHDEPVTGGIKLPFHEFKKDIKKAIGMFPVFEHKNKKWFTNLNPVESIEME